MGKYRTFGDNNRITSYDYIIPLGAGRNSITGELNGTSEEILKTAYGESVLRGKCPYVFALGSNKGSFLEGGSFALTGAEKRARYLMELGVPEKKVIIVNGGRDTIFQAILACREIERRNQEEEKEHPPKCLLITSRQHMPRANYVFEYFSGDVCSIIPLLWVYLPELPDANARKREEKLHLLTESFLRDCPNRPEELRQRITSIQEEEAKRAEPYWDAFYNESKRFLRELPVVSTGSEFETPYPVAGQEEPRAFFYGSYGDSDVGPIPEDALSNWREGRISEESLVQTLRFMREGNIGGGGGGKERE